MYPFRTMLFAADFSEDSTQAFRLAGSLAVENKTRIVVLHVLEPNLVVEEPVYLGQTTMQFYNAGRDEAQYESIKRKLGEVYIPGHAIDVEYHTREGHAAEEILRMADEVGADLIVMGTHGRTGLRRLLAGSVAATVLRGAHCPVLALRSGNRPRPAEEMRVLLHPTDFSDGCEAALRVARSLARDLGARLIVLHILPFDLYLEGRMATGLDPQGYHDSLDMIRQRLDGPDLKQPVETRLCRGYEAEEILRMAQELEADLIVMGTHGWSGLGRLLMGSTAESVLSRADCPVLVVKASRSEAAPTPVRAAVEAEIVP